MSKKQLIADMLERIPEEKLDTVITFIEFVIYESKDEVNNSLLSEDSLSKDWLTKEEDMAWEHL